jgi:hypothetical protein
MRTSLGVQEWVFWLVAFGSAALTFVVRGSRLLWAVLLAAICGVCEARIIFYDHMPDESPARTVDWLLLLVPLVFLGLDTRGRSLVGAHLRLRGWAFRTVLH